MKLNGIIEKYGQIIKGNRDLELVAETLIAAVFSLWRAVFLADSSENSDMVIEDAEDFLTKLIAHNAIGYQQDRGARNWSFVYYTNNADFRIDWLIDDAEVKILTVDEIPEKMGESDKDWWVQNQRAINIAIKNYKKKLQEMSS